VYRLSVLYIFLAVYGLLLPAAALPQEAAGTGSGFFEKGSVRDVFGPEMRTAQAPEIKYFPVQPPKEAPQPVPAAASQPLDSAKAAASPEVAPSMDLDPLAQEKDPVELELIKNYGDPDRESPIKAIDNAPAPFKGMMAALEAKRQDVALRYARQYVRHLKNLRERSEQVMGLTNTALEKEAADSEAAAQKLLQSDREVDSQARALIENAGQLKDSSKDSGQDTEAFGFKEPTSGGLRDSAPMATEAGERELVRRKYAGKLPVDPQGKVDIYFFFQPSDPASLQMAAEIEKLYRAAKGRGNVNLIGMSSTPLTPSQEKSLRAKAGVSFPIADGSKLQEIFEVTSYPTTVLVSQSTSQSHVETGFKRSFYLDEMLKLMEGKKV
jgi:hypothetical protein